MRATDNWNYSEQIAVAVTPVEQHGGYWVKRDDLYRTAGVSGGKARTCWALAHGATGGLVTACGRGSPQANIVACVARALGLQARIHIPSGALEPETELARTNGGVLIQHRPGYNSVIVARAHTDAAELGWREIPFGMECGTAVEQTALQVRNLPTGAYRRLVVPVGSGMSLAGILTGLLDTGATQPVLGVYVGADPGKRLRRYAPFGYTAWTELIPAGVPYGHPLHARLGGLALDPYYEAKCVRFLTPGDLLWVVGHREGGLR